MKMNQKKYVASLIMLLLIAAYNCGFAQDIPVKKEKFPSYFGLQVRPIFPTQFIGSSTTELTKGEFSSTLTQKMGYSFGGTIRAGLTKLISLETGINFTQRNFDIAMSVVDSGVFATNNISFISYDVPLNALIYIQLDKQFFMNASLGAALTYKPTNVGVLTMPGSFHSFTHTGKVSRKGGLDLNANIGFEYRTEKSGFFYIGGSARVPFKPLFDIIAQYKYQGYKNTIYGEIDGSYLALDFKYFFPNIRNQGTQFKRGPIL
ncbi:MAG: hypothetical protein RL265_173 [Bacteroidota bacterium]|jgi:hypothetical protein